MRSRRLQAIAFTSFLSACAAAAFGTTTLRIVSYNIDDADQGNDNNITATYAGLPTVLQAIGQHHIGSNAQPIDVLGVEELNSTTLANLTNALNAIYGAGTYAFDTTPDLNSGGGPDGLIYNTKTVKVVSAVAIGTVGTSGAARDPMRYLIQPVGYDTDSQFYMYVSHYKASSDSTSQNRRNVEATEIRQDADALGASAHIIYSGDFNLTNGPSEAAYQTLVAAGNGQAHDVANPNGNWVNSTASWKYLFSESTTTLDTRFDFQLVSGAVLNQPGVQIAPDTSDPFTGNFPSSKYPYAYEIFGNNGTTGTGGKINSSANTSLMDLPNATTVLNDLMEPYTGNNNEFVGSDHLPIVADYIVSGIAPTQVIWNGGSGTWSIPSNWNINVAPNAAKTEVLIDNGKVVNSVVTLDQNAAVSDVILNSGDQLTINSGSTLTINGPASSTFSGTLINNGSIVQSGGAMTLGALTGSGSMTIAASATATSISQNSLSVTGTLKIASNGGNSGVTVVNSLSITGNGSLDLTNNDLIINYTGTSPIATIRGYLASAYNGGSWTGTGLTSSAAANDSSSKTALGYCEASDIGASTFDGQSIPANAVLVKYTYYGDANLDGVVNLDDFSIFIDGFNGLGSGWIYGDFNYDGVIDQSDFSLFVTGFNLNGQPLSTLTSLIQNDAQLSSAQKSALLNAVPEPTAISIIAFAISASLTSRRRLK